MKRLILAASLVLGAFTAAQADPITYDLDGYEFIGGNGTITGNFTIDTDTGDVTDVNITFSSGDLLVCNGPPCPPENFVVVDSFEELLITNDTTIFPDGGNTNFALSNVLDGAISYFVFSFQGLFPENGGTVNSAFVAQWQCPTTQFCERSIFNTPLRTSVVGQAISRPVPEPASLAILGMGLFGMGLARRRRQS